MSEDDRAIVRRICEEIMGWRGHTVSGTQLRFMLEQSSALGLYVSREDGHGAWFDWHPLTDLNHAAEMERVIAFSSKQDAYITALDRILDREYEEYELSELSDRALGLKAAWLIATATPRQRVQACIAMLESEGKR